MQRDHEDFPVYHLSDLLPDQIAVIQLLGNPKIVGSYETATFLADPARGISPPHYRSARGGMLVGMGRAHAVIYTCPVVMILGRPKIVMPNGDLSEVEMKHVGPPAPHWMPQ